MTFRRSARHAATTLLCLLAGLMLGGCGTLMERFSSKKDNAGGEVAPAPLRAVYRFEVKAPSAALRQLLTNYLDLARFQNLPVTESVSQAEIDRLTAAAPAQARSLLETEGYFNSSVIIEQEAAPLTASAPESEQSADAYDRRVLTSLPRDDLSLPLIRVEVEPGPRAVVQRVDIGATGDAEAAAASGDARAAATLKTLRDDWPLKVGEPFRQADWASAKSGSLAQLRANGYAAAAWTATSAHVEAESNSVQLSATVESGPLFKLGELRIEGLQRYGPEVVRNLAGFGPGTPYSEKLLLDYQERLQKVGLFEGVVVEVDTAVQNPAGSPVTVRLRELPFQQTTLGAGISANTGERVSIEHLQRRVFGWDWQARNKVVMGHDLSSWEGQLTSYPHDDLYRNLIAGSAEKLRSDTDVRNSISARVGRTRETERMDRLYYLEVQRAEVVGLLGTTLSDAVSVNYQWIWRDLDSVLLPTRGKSASLQLGSGYARSDTADSGPFARSLARLTFYRPLGGGWFGQARVEAGQVFAADAVGIPDTLLFRAGGDDSVRGYAYRTLGPQVNGVLSSGRVMTTGSLEVARPILASLPTLWGAAFIDAGNAAQNWRDMSLAFGYGVGVRLRSPVGPLKVDLAYGQELRKVRLHLSVGVTF